VSFLTWLASTPPQEARIAATSPFNLEGVFINSFTASLLPTSLGATYRALSIEFPSAAAIPLAPGSYKFTWLARDCTNTKSVILPELVTFGIFAP